MKKFLDFVFICLYVLGVIGGIGSSIYCNAWPCAFGVGFLAWASFPKMKEIFLDFIESKPKDKEE